MQTSYAVKNLMTEQGIKDQSVSGMIVNILYEDATSDFKIFVVEGDGIERVKCRGTAPTLRLGLDVRCTGSYSTHPRYGKQFDVDGLQVILPTASLMGLQGFLSSGAVDGVGFTLAYEIVNHFKTVTAVKQALRDPQLLQQVNGIGEISAQTIASSYQAIEHRVAFLSKCFEYGLDTKIALQILEAYPGDPLAVLEGAPYDLLTIPGVPWDAIDEIALQQLHMDPSDPARISAGIGQGLKRGTLHTGNTFLYEDQLYDEVFPLLHRSPTTNDIETAAEKGVISAERVSSVEGNDIMIYYPTGLYTAEQKVATRLTAMVKNSTPVPSPQVFLSQEASILDTVQRSAVLNALQSSVSYITGFPGTGKTFLLKIILQELRMRDIHNPLLCAPTGRAAKQMEKSTHIKASTIHRALGFDGDHFLYNRHNPLTQRTIVVDEASMADINLFYHLVDALPNDARLIIIGDVDQLPSVGPGNILSDIIDSRAIPGVRLEKIYRQGKGSQIPRLSKSINEYQPGQPLPELPLFTDDLDVGFIPAHMGNIEAEIRLLVNYTLPHMGFGPDDIQVLSPRKTGPGSVDTLNKELREALNPGDPHDDFGRFRIGDKVMQTKNVYDILFGTDVMNGDQGWVRRVSGDGKSLFIEIEGVGEVPYTVADLKNLTHAYCITVHKSQGGQYPAVVLSLLPQHGRLLSRSLLYTAITRAEQKIIIVGDQTAFAKAVRTKESSLRQTLLMERLQDLAR